MTYEGNVCGNYWVHDVHAVGSVWEKSVYGIKGAHVTGGVWCMWYVCVHLAVYVKNGAHAVGGV